MVLQNVENRAITKIVFCFGVSILIGLSSVLIMLTTSYYLGMALLPYSFIVGSFLGGVYLIASIYKIAIRPFKSYTWLFFGLLYGLLFFGSIWTAERVIDFSYDGQSYQQQGILQLVYGWNPIREDTASYGPIKSHDILWQNTLVTYTKGSWEMEASISALTGNMESGKAVNFLVTVAAFLIAFATIYSLGNLGWAFTLILCIILVFNPVNITQLFTFYVDGILGSLLLIVFCVLWQIYYRIDSHLLVALITSVGLIVTIKLSGAVSVIIFCCGYLALFYITKNAARKEYLLGLTFALCLGIVYLGYSPYLTNILNREDMISHLTLDSNMPRTFADLSAPQKLFISLFSTVNNNTLDTPKLKIPFSLSGDEFLPFVGNDVRVSGFGPLFGGCLIVALLCLLIFPKRALITQTLLPLTFFLGILIVSVFINPEAWWARFVPQLWLLPAVVAILLINIRQRVQGYLSKFLTAALLVNILIVAFFYGAGQVYGQEYYYSQIKQVESLPAPVEINFQYLVANKIRLEYWRIPYTEGISGNCRTQIMLYRSDTFVCVSQK